MPVTVTENASLRALNTFRVEQRAARLLACEDPSDIPEAVDLLRQAARRLVLGGGSNVLFTQDFDGTVLLLRTRGRRLLDAGAQAFLVEAEAGEPWDGFVRWTLAQGFGGLENLALIPGSVGASPIQNIGAYGLEMREFFAELDAIDLDSGERRTFSPADCAFGYRDSVFKQAGGRRWLVARVRFRLPRRWTPRLEYGELRAELAAHSTGEPSPMRVADAVSAIRRRKLPDPAILGNAGSFFKNPVVAAPQAQALRERFPDLPAWPSDGQVKLSAAWMIERCGWKARREGDAGVHASHALVLVNHGQATGAQLLALAQRIRASVAAEFGIAIEPEPLIL